MRNNLSFMAGISRCFLVLLLLYLGTAQAETFGLAARVNGQEVTAKRFEHYFEDFLSDRGRNIASIRNPEVLKKLRREALEALIDEELLWQEAQRQGIAASPQEIDAAVERMRSNFRTPDAFARRLERAGFTEASYRAYLAQQLAVKQLVEERIQVGITVSDREVHRFYKANPARFAIPEQRRLRLILIGAEGSAADARSRCETILAQVRRPRADFAALAKQHSQHPSAERGGDLDYVSPGQLPQALEAAAFALKAGEVSAVVETDLGCHILKLEGRRSGLLPENEARETTRNYLKGEKGQQVLRKHIEALRRQAGIEILMPM